MTMRGITALFLVALTTLGACSQSRKSISSGGTDDLSDAQQICAIPSNLASRAVNGQAIGCFELRINKTSNEAVLTPVDLGFDPAEVSYRVLVYRKGDSRPQVLKNSKTKQESLDTTIGGDITLSAASGDKIHQYEEWHIELVKNYDSNGLLFDVAVSSGILVAAELISWPEFEEQ